MRPTPKSIRPTPTTATRHLRPVLTDWLARAVRLPARRRTCTPGVVWQVILFPAAFARSVAAACAARPAAPSGLAVWDVLRSTRPNRRRAARVAIDYHRIGYVGVPNRDTTRAKEKAGAHTFPTYATPGAVGRPGRYPPGLTAVGGRAPSPPPRPGGSVRRPRRGGVRPGWCCRTRRSSRSRYCNSPSPGTCRSSSRR